MLSRDNWSVALTGAATIWLLVAGWLSLVGEVSGLDRLAIGLGFVIQLSVVMAWDLLPRLPLWIIAGHGLIMLSLALGLVITAPGPMLTSLAYGLPWLVAGLVPPGAAMLLASGLRWRPAQSLAH